MYRKYKLCLAYKQKTRKTSSTKNLYPCLQRKTKQNLFPEKQKKTLIFNPNTAIKRVYVQDCVKVLSHPSFLYILLLRSWAFLKSFSELGLDISCFFIRF